MRLSRNVIAIFLTIPLFGCATINIPDGYVKVNEKSDYDLKAVSARGNVIACKARPNEDSSATLAYWSEAVAYQKVDIDGMKLVARKDIKSANGLDGVFFDFETGEGQGRHTYLVALYVTPSRIFTVEATGPTSMLEPDREKLVTAMTSLH